MLLDVAWFVLGVLMAGGAQDSWNSWELKLGRSSVMKKAIAQDHKGYQSRQAFWCHGSWVNLSTPCFSEPGCTRLCAPITPESDNGTSACSFWYWFWSHLEFRMFRLQTKIVAAPLRHVRMAPRLLLGDLDMGQKLLNATAQLVRSHLVAVAPDHLGSLRGFGKHGREETSCISVRVLKHLSPHQPAIVLEKCKNVGFLLLFATCIIPCACHAKRSWDVEKWPEHVVILQFWLLNRPHATAPCNFWLSQFEKAARSPQLLHFWLQNRLRALVWKQPLSPKNWLGIVFSTAWKTSNGPWVQDAPWPTFQDGLAPGGSCVLCRGWTLHFSFASHSCTSTEMMCSSKSQMTQMTCYIFVGSMWFPACSFCVGHFELGCSAQGPAPRCGGRGLSGLSL